MRLGLRMVAGMILLAALGLGCSDAARPPTGPAAKPAAQQTSDAQGEETAVRDAFSAFQAALKAKDAGKLWDLLDSDSRSDADRAAKALQAAYAKASAEEKAEQEKALGLTAAELTALNGQGFLKTTRFLGKHHEVPGSKIDKVVVQAGKATVTYIEEDGDVEKLNAVREDGKWKLSVAMPE